MSDHYGLCRIDEFIDILVGNFTNRGIKVTKNWPLPLTTKFDGTRIIINSRYMPTPVCVGKDPLGRKFIAIKGKTIVNHKLTKLQVGVIFNCHAYNTGTIISCGDLDILTGDLTEDCSNKNIPNQYTAVIKKISSILIK